MMSSELQRFIKELEGIEWVINRLVTTRSVPTATLEIHLRRLAEVIYRLPKGEIQLVEKWSSKLNHLIRKYSKNVMRQAVRVSMNSSHSGLWNESLALLNHSSSPETVEDKFFMIDCSIQLLLSMPAPPAMLIIRNVTDLITLGHEVSPHRRNKWDQRIKRILEVYQLALARTSSASSQIDSLEADLVNLESRIVSLLDTGCRHIDLIHLWISDLTRLVAFIPSEKSFLKEEWNDKVSHLLKKVVSFSAEESSKHSSTSLQEWRQCVQQQLSSERPSTQDNNELHHSSGVEETSVSDYLGDSCAQLHQFLEEIEKEIASLMMVFKSSDLEQLDANIGELCELINSIPRQHQKLSDKWLDKIGTLMHHYRNLVFCETSQITKDVDWTATPSNPSTSYNPPPINPRHWTLLLNASSSSSSISKHSYDSDKTITNSSGEGSANSINVSSLSNSIDWTAPPSNPSPSYRPMPVPNLYQSEYWDARPSSNGSVGSLLSEKSDSLGSFTSLMIVEESEANSCKSFDLIESTNKSIACNVPSTFFRCKSLEFLPNASNPSYDSDKTITNISGEGFANGINVSSLSKSIDWTAPPSNPSPSYRPMPVQNLYQSEYWDVRPPLSFSSDETSGNVSSRSLEGRCTKVEKAPSMIYGHLYPSDESMHKTMPATYNPNVSSNINSSLDVNTNSIVIESTPKKPDIAIAASNTESSSSIDWTVDPSGSFKAKDVENWPQFEFWNPRPCFSIHSNSTQSSLNGSKDSLPLKVSLEASLTVNEKIDRQTQLSSKSAIQPVLLTHPSFDLLDSHPNYIQGLVGMAFHLLEPIEDDVRFEEKIHKLIYLVALSKKVANHCLSGSQLTSFILNCATLKLNNRLSEKLKRKVTRLSLASLLFFLCDMSQSNSSQLTTSTLPTVYMASICAYCKFRGHLKVNCPKIKLLRCFACFQSGHTEKWCNQPELSALELLRLLQTMSSA